VDVVAAHSETRQEELVIQTVTVTVDTGNVPTDENEIRTLFAKGVAIRVLSVKISEPTHAER
jgi:hypothetical protein